MRWLAAGQALDERRQRIGKLQAGADRELAVNVRKMHLHRLLLGKLAASEIAADQLAESEALDEPDGVGNSS
jgi:hypothetical protein